MSLCSPPKIEKTFLTWGINMHFQVNYGSNGFVNFIPINRYEYLSITVSHIYLCEREIVKESASAKLISAVYIPKFDFIIGISSTTNRFIVFRKIDLNNSYETNIYSGQIGIFHMLFSSKSGMLITVGQDIRVWHFDCLHPDVRLLSNSSDIIITLQSVINTSPDSSILNPPCFDYEREQLIIPSERGFKRESLEGKFIEFASRIPSNYITPIDYVTSNNSIVTYDQVEGICNWLSDATLIFRHQFNEESIISIRSINSEFIIFLDTKLNVYLADIKTNHSFHIITLYEKPKRMIIYQSFGYKLAFCFRTQLIVYNLIVPWHLWSSMIFKPLKIERCPLKQSAARIVVQRKTDLISLISPRTSEIITSASLLSPSCIRFVFYDRHEFCGIFSDQLLLVQKNGYVSLFGVGTIPCNLISEIDLNAVSIFGFVYKNTFCYCVGTRSGDILICNSNDLEIEKRIVILKMPLISVFYDEKYQTVLMVYESFLIRYDIVHSILKEKICVNGGIVNGYKNEFLVIGYKNGFMNFVSVKEDSLFLFNNDGKHLHSDQVTGLSFSANYFMSASLDCSIKVWSYDGINISTISFPFPIYEVEILNGKRDFIFGTDKGLMIVEGTEIFDEKFEKEDPLLDNFNRLVDNLSEKTTISIIDPEIKKSILESNNVLEKNNHDSESLKADDSFVYVDLPPLSPISKKSNEIDDFQKNKIFMQMISLTDNEKTAVQVPPILKESSKQSNQAKPSQNIEKEINKKEETKKETKEEKKTENPKRKKKNRNLKQNISNDSKQNISNDSKQNISNSSKQNILDNSLKNIFKSGKEKSKENNLNENKSNDSKNMIFNSDSSFVSSNDDKDFKNNEIESYSNSHEESENDISDNSVVLKSKSNNSLAQKSQNDSFALSNSNDNFSSEKAINEIENNKNLLPYDEKKEKETSEKNDNIIENEQIKKDNESHQSKNINNQQKKENNIDEISIYSSDASSSSFSTSKNKKNLHRRSKAIPNTNQSQKTNKKTEAKPQSEKKNKSKQFSKSVKPPHHKKDLSKSSPRKKSNQINILNQQPKIELEKQNIENQLPKEELEKPNNGNLFNSIKLVRTCYRSPHSFSPPSLKNKSSFNPPNYNASSLIRLCNLSRKRARTPPVNKSYNFPSPNFVLDVNEIFNQIENGDLTLLPIITRLNNDGYPFVNQASYNESTIDKIIQNYEIKNNTINFINLPELTEMPTTFLQKNVPCIHFSSHSFHDCIANRNSFNIINDSNFSNKSRTSRIKKNNNDDELFNFFPSDIFMKPTISNNSVRKNIFQNSNEQENKLRKNYKYLDNKNDQIYQVYYHTSLYAETNSNSRNLDKIQQETFNFDDSNQSLIIKRLIKPKTTTNWRQKGRIKTSSQRFHK